jgi:hypothetical protein
MAGTLGRADLYGQPSTVGGAMDPLSVQNPNGATVAPITQTASGGSTAGAGGGAAVSVVALIVGLVALRVLIELSERAD